MKDNPSGSTTGAGEGEQEREAQYEQELVIRAERGDREAITELFERFADLVLSIGLRMLRDRGEAEDFVQDLFLNLFHKIRGFDPSKGSARTWIVQIAYHRAFNRREYLQTRRFWTGTELETVEHTLEDGSELECQLADSIMGSRLHQAFGELAERHRRTLEMYFFEGLELREIAERLGESLENTRHFYYRGIDRLRAIAQSQIEASRNQRSKKQS